MCGGWDCQTPLRDGPLCHECARRAVRALWDVALLARELETTVARQDRAGSVGGSSRGQRAHDDADDKTPLAISEQPLVINVSAAERGRRVLELLFEWADFVAAGNRRKGLPVFARDVSLQRLVPAAVAILLERPGWMRQHEQGPDLAEAIHCVRRDLRAIVDRRPERVYAGPCHGELGYDTDQRYRCAAPLYRAWGSDTITCDGYRPGQIAVPEGGCGAVHEAAARHAWLVEETRGQLLPLRLVWESLYVLVPGCQVDWPTAQRWTRERRVRQRVETKPGAKNAERIKVRVIKPRLPVRSVSAEGVPLYRVSDILRLADDKAPRKGRRRRTRGGQEAVQVA